MKGLLLKDFYMMLKYCRAYLLMVVVFIAVSLVNSESFLFAFYPCMLCGMIPVTLLSYDERSKWLHYSATMPYTKSQIVSGKYLIGLCIQAAMLLVTGIAQAVRMSLNGAFSWEEYLVLMLMLMAMALLTSSISLPFMFKLGVEKGIMAYYVMIGVVCGGSVVASSLLEESVAQEVSLNAVLPLLCLASVGVYALSWYLSIVFFRKREI